MKKSLINTFLSFLFISSACFGQSIIPNSKNNYLIGGIIDFNVRSTKFQHDNMLINDKLTTIEVSPDFAYFIINKFALGLQINSSFSLQKYLADGSKYKSNSLLASPYFRWYFYKGFFSELSLGIGKKQTNFDTWNIIQGKVTLGYSIFIKNNIALEPVFSFIRTSEKTGSETDYNINYDDINMSISFQTFF